MHYFIAFLLLWLTGCEGPHANVPRELRSPVAEQSFKIEMLRWVDAEGAEHIDRLFTVVAPDSPIEREEITVFHPRVTLAVAYDICQKMTYAGRSGWRLPTFGESLQLRKLDFNKLSGLRHFDAWVASDRDLISELAFFCVRTPQ